MNPARFEREQYTRESRINALSAVFVTVNILDLILTVIALENFGFFEINPLARAVMASMGAPGLVAAKAALMMIFLSACWLASASERAKLAWAGERALRIGTILVTLAVLWNLLNIIVEIV